jgi:hypothetical protein
VVDFEQTRFPAIRYSLTRMVTEGIAMFTSAECLGVAEQKLAEAECDPQHRRRLRKAAEAWLILANQLIRAEGAKRTPSAFWLDQASVESKGQ